MSTNGKKKLVIRRETVSALKVQTGVKTGATCDNDCGGTSDKCPDAATKCPDGGKMLPI
jgi:hypothetical protein